MTGYLPEELINDLRHRVDIVDVIGEYVPLKKQGQNYIGLCPFHSEKTPSFVVSPQKQIYHCFGCGKGGNVFSFLMEKNAMTFSDSVLFLAKRCGLALPKTAVSPENAKRDSLRKRYYHINEITSQYYHAVLQGKEGQHARMYLKKRGVSEETQEKFLLGYAPQEWEQLSRYLLDKGVAEQELIILGLAVITQKGNLVDRFRARIIFPIMDDAGRVIGFGGRVLDDSQPKYLNSPDTPLFTKGKFLYGMHLAKGSIRNQDQAIIMEGYMDVITAHQSGITNTIGTLGTALTIEQARLLMRFSYNACICFDADQAGQKAALRGLDILQEQGCRVTIVTTTQFKDPDEYIKKQGNKAFLELVQKADTLLEYKLKRLMEQHDIQTIPGKIQTIQALLPDIQKVQSPVARQAFIQLIGERLAFPETAIHAEIRKSMSRHEPRVEGVEKQAGTESASQKAQKILIRLIAEKPEVLPEIEKWGGSELFSISILREIYESNYLLHQAGHNIKANDLIGLLNDSESQRFLSRILLEDTVPEEWERVLKDCLALLRMELLNKKIAEKSVMMTQYEKKGEVSRSLEIMAEVQKLVREKQSRATTLGRGGNNFEDRKRN